jgi:tripeptidyl-peptidase-1
MQIMLGVSVLSIAFVVQAVFCSPVQKRAGYTVKETHYVPQKWSKVGKAADDFMIHLNIGLKQNNFEELDRHLYEGMLFRN